MEILGQHKDPQTNPIEDLVRFASQGVIPNAEEIAALKAMLLADRTVSRDEADLLFKLKHMIADIDEAPGFHDLFVDGITSHLLYTGDTDGALDSMEFLWLSEQFSNDVDRFDDLDKALLVNVEMRAESVPANFIELAEKFK